MQHIKGQATGRQKKDMCWLFII